MGEWDFLYICTNAVMLLYNYLPSSTRMRSLGESEMIARIVLSLIDATDACFIVVQDRKCPNQGHGVYGAYMASFLSLYVAGTITALKGVSSASMHCFSNGRVHYVNRKDIGCGPQTNFTTGHGISETT